VRSQKRAPHLTGLFAVLVLVAGLAGGLPARAGPIRPAAVVSFSGDLSSVAATSPSNAWAVGFTSSSSSVKPLILHWNGASWGRVPNPAQTGGDQLFGIAATSASSAWVVGCSRCYTSKATSLILRWNGAVWKRVPVPRIAGGSSGLSSVAATSASSAWAVGASTTALILRWNGTVWKRVPSPRIAGSYSLSSVAATSASNAWAVGEVVSGRSFNGLILHWNGTTWRRVASPPPKYGKYGNALRGVAATSAANAWAVGCTDGCPVFGGNPVIARWNGTAWKQVAAPTTPYSVYGLGAVAAISSTSAWAVGGNGPVTDESASAAHWNGHRWTLSKGISGASLGGVAATSATNAWAVGGTVHGRTLILHWNGTTWKRS
jgi:hypothetical protein